MSIDAISQIWEIPLDSTTKLVMLCLANHANDEGMAWPSVSRVAKMTGLTDRAIRTCLGKLRAMGLLLTVAKSNHHKATTYKLNLKDFRGECGSGEQRLAELGSKEGCTTFSQILKRTFKDELTPLPPRGEKKVERVSPFEFETKGSSWQLPQAKLDEWQKTFPDLDVEGQLRRAAQWLRDNPSKQKTPGGMPRFLGSWLLRAADRKPTKPHLADDDGFPLPTEAEARRALAAAREAS